MKFVAFALLALSLCACEPRNTENFARQDQCLGAQLFKDCLASVPMGPTHTVASNDWDEIVSECGLQAREFSLRPKSKIPEGCYAGVRP